MFKHYAVKVMALSLSLSCVAAHAEGAFHGLWKGVGQKQSTSMGTMLCEAATIEIQQTVATFDFTVRKFMCDGLINQWAPFGMEITNKGVVVLDGKAVGTLKGQVLSAAWKTHETDEEGKPTEPTYWELSTKIEDGVLHYEMKQTYYQWVSIITAQLTRK